jgi:TonB family protein
MIKATVVLLLAHLIIPRMRRRSAAERHACWAASLATAAVVPLLGLVVPSWQPEWARRVSDALPAAFGAVTPGVTSGSADIIVRATGVEPVAWTLGTAIVALWILGTIAILLVLAVEAVKVRRLASSAQPVRDARRIDMAQAIAGALHFRAPPLVMESSRTALPIAWGLRRACILLPLGAGDWSDERLQAVLTHEMAHVRRGDWLTHVLAELTCALYWFHPLVWTARNQLCRESEQAADDEVLNLGTTGTDYAAHLLDIVRAARTRVRGLAPTVAMARGSGLERRVASLLNGLANRTIVTRRRLIAIAAVTIIIALPLAAIGAREASMRITVRTTDLPPLAEAATGGLTEGATAALRRVRALRELSAPGPWTTPEIAEYTTPPLYSDEARRLGVEGIVTAQAHVDESGNVTGVRVVKGLGLGLDQNALVALRQWRFRPGTRDGSPIAMDVEVEVEFTMRNETINALIANDMATLVGPGVTPPSAVRAVQLKPGTIGARGIVILDVVLLEDGTPRIVRILRSLSPDADEAAVRSFEQWRFSPALKDGRPIKVRMNAEVSFRG